MRKERDQTLLKLNAALRKRDLIVPYKAFGIKRSKLPKTEAGRIAIMARQQEREENDSVN